MQRISGKNWTPFFIKICYPYIVVGPFAAYTISLALNLSALLALIAFSRAAGIKKSTGL